jgi:hypothetical protein
MQYLGLCNNTTDYFTQLRPLFNTKSELSPEFSFLRWVIKTWLLLDPRFPWVTEVDSTLVPNDLLLRRKGKRAVPLTIVCNLGSMLRHETRLTQDILPPIPVERDSQTQRVEEAAILVVLDEIPDNHPLHPRIAYLDQRFLDETESVTIKLLTREFLGSILLSTFQNGPAQLVQEWGKEIFQEVFEHVHRRSDVIIHTSRWDQEKKEQENLRTNRARRLPHSNPKERRRLSVPPSGVLVPLGAGKRSRGRSGGSRLSFCTSFSDSALNEREDVINLRDINPDTTPREAGT